MRTFLLLLACTWFQLTAVSGKRKEESADEQLARQYYKLRTARRSAFIGNDQEELADMCEQKDEKRNETENLNVTNPEAAVFKEYLLAQWNATDIYICNQRESIASLSEIASFKIWFSNFGSTNFRFSFSNQLKIKFGEKSREDLCQEMKNDNTAEKNNLTQCLSEVSVSEEKNATLVSVITAVNNTIDYSYKEMKCEGKTSTVVSSITTTTTTSTSTRTTTRVITRKPEPQTSEKTTATERTTQSVPGPLDYNSDPGPKDRGNPDNGIGRKSTGCVILVLLAAIASL